MCFKYKNKDELYSAVNMLGDIFGEDAQTYAAKWDNKLDETIAKIADAYKFCFLRQVLCRAAVNA